MTPDGRADKRLPFRGGKAGGKTPGTGRSTHKVRTLQNSPAACMEVNLFWRLRRLPSCCETSLDDQSCDNKLTNSSDTSVLPDFSLHMRWRAASNPNGFRTFSLAFWIGHKCHFDLGKAAGNFNVNP